MREEECSTVERGHCLVAALIVSEGTLIEATESWMNVINPIMQKKFKTNSVGVKEKEKEKERNVQRHEHGDRETTLVME